MTSQLDLRQAITEYLSTDTVSSYFDQMGSSLTNHLTSNEYHAYLQVITWTVLEKLKNSNSFPISQLNENTVGPLVNNTIIHLCNLVPQDPGYPSLTPSCLMSRVIWWSLKCLGRELS